MLLLFLCFYLPGLAQITVQFIPETYGRNVNGLFACRLTNLNQKQVVSMVITVNERKGGIVCQVNVPEFTLLPGTNPIPVTAAHSAGIKFGSGRLGQITGRSGSFPEGDYEYCYEISFQHSDNPPMEQCFSYTLAPFAELNLIDPYNQDKICDKRPVLTWQPLIPAILGSRYQLVLTEIKDGQSPTEALNYNLPIINQSNLSSPVLPYPPIARELQNKKKYAWQVTAYKDQTILNRSDIWEFTIDCQDSVKKVIDDGGYRNIEDLLKGNFYIAKGYIKFALVNPYEAQKLKYEITSINNINKKIKGLPKIDLVNGLNKIIIDLYENGTLSAGQYYIMKVKLPNGSTKSLRFLYQNADE
jgi:hypothetical protein